MKRVIFGTVLGLWTGSAWASDFLPVCERTPAVRDFLSMEVNKECAAITPFDLLSVTRVAVPNKQIKAFHALDFSGLPNLEILNITRNPITEIPVGLTKDLPKLRVLVVFDTELAYLPEDFLEGNEKMEDLHIFENPFTTIPASVWYRLETYTHWKNLDFNRNLVVDQQERLNRLFPDNGPVILEFY